jgi:hypothetical protein
LLRIHPDDCAAVIDRQMADVALVKAADKGAPFPEV